MTSHIIYFHIPTEAFFPQIYIFPIYPVFSISTTAVSFHHIPSCSEHYSDLLAGLTFPLLLQDNQLWTYLLRRSQGVIQILPLLCWKSFSASHCTLNKPQTPYPYLYMSKWAKTKQMRKVRLFILSLLRQRGQPPSLALWKRLQQAEKWKSFIMEKKKRRRLVCFIEGCGHGEAISSLTRREASYAIG